MNSITRALITALLKSDHDLSPSERRALQSILAGRCEQLDEPPLPALLSQTEVAELLSLNRATIWRMVQKKLLHPIEVTPGVFRYSSRELKKLITDGWRATYRPMELQPDVLRLQVRNNLPSNVSTSGS